MALRGLQSFEKELSSYSDFWRDKLAYNVEQDKAITDASDGWLVIRLLESDIRKDLDDCVEQIVAARNARR